MLVRNLLMLVYEKNISAILCDKKKLNVVEEIVREVCLKLFGKEKDVEEKKVLQHLYDVSDDARAEFCNKRILMELIKFSEISRENTPNIYEMMSKLIKK